MIRQRRQSGDGPRHRQVIPAGAAHPHPGLAAAHIHLVWPGLARQAGQQPVPVLGLLLGTIRQIGLVAAIAGADAVRATKSEAILTVFANVDTYSDSKRLRKLLDE